MEKNIFSHVLTTRERLNSSWGGIAMGKGSSALRNSRLCYDGVVVYSSLGVKRRRLSREVWEEKGFAPVHRNTSTEIKSSKRTAKKRAGEKRALPRFTGILKKVRSRHSASRQLVVFRGRKKKPNRKLSIISISRDNKGKGLLLFRK